MGLAVMEGIWVGYTANSSKRIEDSAFVGVNRFVTTTAQIASIDNALYIAEMALKSSSPAAHGSFSTSVRYVLYLTPLVTNVLCSKLDLRTHPYLKRSLLVINAHIGSVCQLAVIISSVALIILGQTALGTVALAFVVVGFVQRRCWLPFALNKGIDAAGFVGVNVARVVLGSPLQKFMAFCEMGHFAYLRLSKNGLLTAPLQERRMQEEEQELALSLTNIPPSTSLFTDLSHLRVNAAVPPPPLVDLESLHALFNQFDLQAPFYRLKLSQIVSEDEHWQEFHSDKNGEEELIAYVQTGLSQFVANVSNCAIRSGEIHDYRSLQARAKHIAHQLPFKSQEDQWINLLHLGLAAHYCPAGYLEKVRSVYYTVCDSVEEDSLESKLAQVLSDARRHLFQSFLHNLWRENPMRHLVDHADVHVYNEFVNLLGENFHLSEREDAQQDSLSYIDILSKKMLNALYQPLIKPFIARYDRDFVVESAYEGLANGLLSHELMERWFVDAYLESLRSQLPASMEEDREANRRLLEEATTWVRENVYDLMTGKIEERYLNFFLIKMGVLKVEPN